MPSRATSRKPSRRSGRPADGPPKAPRRKRAADTAAAARPFLKWAGGKRQLVQELTKHVPESFGTYYEPFVGGGALFFHLQPRSAVLSDSNARLIRTYSGIQNNVDDVIAILSTYRNEKSFYLKLREIPIDERSDAELAAWFIFLNKTGFNGLYRVNRRNLFNVPFGDNARARIVDDLNLKACSAALKGVQLHCEDFEAALTRAGQGDFVYIDPPYVPLSDTAYFTSYTSSGFGPQDQLRLRDAALALKRRGVTVVLSNSSSHRVSELYGAEFTCIPVSASRLVNSDTKGRGKVTEFVIV
jgi:DNA adenine methylase